MCSACTDVCLDREDVCSACEDVCLACSDVCSARADVCSARADVRTVPCPYQVMPRHLPACLLHQKQLGVTTGGRDSAARVTGGGMIGGTVVAQQLNEIDLKTYINLRSSLEILNQNS